jgi:hypothetical protein
MADPGRRLRVQCDVIGTSWKFSLGICQRIGVNVSDVDRNKEISRSDHERSENCAKPIRRIT